MISANETRKLHKRKKTKKKKKFPQKIDREKKKKKNAVLVLPRTSFMSL